MFHEQSKYAPAIRRRSAGFVRQKTNRFETVSQKLTQQAGRPLSLLAHLSGIGPFRACPSLPEAKVLSSYTIFSATDFAWVKSSR
jgi:hypothetical protein